jgi:zinc protease
MVKIVKSCFYRYIFVTVLVLFTIFVNNKHIYGKGNAISMKYQKISLDNGLSIIMVEHHELPIVAIELLVKAGSVHDPQEKYGLAHIVSQLLREGTRSKDSLEISEEIDFIGGSLRVNCGYDSTSVSTTALVKHFNTILDLLADVARCPIFKTKDIDRHKDKATTAILREKDNKTSIADRHFSQMLYGKHPYAHPPIGTIEGLKAISGNEIKWFHKTRFLPNNSILTVVGDIKPTDILDDIKDAFGDWKKGDIPKQTLPPIPKIKGYRIRIVDKPDLTQTEIRLGHPGIARDDTEYFPLMLMNYILGKGPTSRLYTKVRAEKGLTYGANSSFELRKLRGAFYVRTYSKNETAIEALRLVLEGLKELKSKGVTKEELDRAKSFYIGHYPLSMETPAQIATKILEQEFYSLPDDYLEKYLDNIKAVSIKDVDHAIKRILDPENLIITLVSRTEDILEEAKDIGEVELENL